LCDCDHRRHVEAQVEALLATAEEDISVNFRPCDIWKEIQSLELRKARGFAGIPNECLRHFPRRLLVYFTHLYNHCFRLCHFPEPWKEAKIINLPNPCKDPNFTQIYVRLASCLLWANYLTSWF
jgi:hypothetical protein